MQWAITLLLLPLGDSYITAQLFLLLFILLSQNLVLLDCVLVHLTLQTGTVEVIHSLLRPEKVQQWRQCIRIEEGIREAVTYLAPAAGNSHVRGCLRLSAVRRARAGIIPLCSALVRWLLRNCAQFQASQLQREIHQLKTVQPRATDTVGKLKLEMCTETLRELLIWPGEEKVKKASNYYLRYSQGETRSSQGCATKGQKAAVTKGSSKVDVKKKISRWL